ncbi:MAG TPA: hypothetical protein DCR93_26075, partial [Cytophagales bacterium]|nr:hypothetical protein [Cytophagales bacterium]
MRQTIQLASLVLFLLTPGWVWGQNDGPVFGVRANLVIPKSNSPFLSDYSDGTSGLQLTLSLADNSRSQYDFLLKFSLTPLNGSTPILESKTNYGAGPFTVFNTSPAFLTGPDLDLLLSPNNLIFPDPGAFDQATFLSNGKLPEGRYLFEVWAIDVNRPDQQVSNKTRAIISTLLSDPPQWQLPRNEEIVTATDPQNVVFSWSPNNGLGAASVADTRYTFKIWELADEGLDPNWVALSLNPLEEVVDVLTPQLVFNQFNTPLIPGMRYAIRVQATDINGRDVFRHGGKSEVQVFQFGRACTAANLFVAESKLPTQANLSWNAGEANSRYEIKYREAGNASAEWFTEDSYTSTIKLQNLRAGTEYEYEVFPYCGTLTAPSSGAKTFTTPDAPVSPPGVTLECGN